MCNKDHVLQAGQVYIVQHGFNVPSLPCSKKPVDAIRPRIIFEIVLQYCFPKEEIVEIELHISKTCGCRRLRIRRVS